MGLELNFLKTDVFVGEDESIDLSSLHQAGSAKTRPVVFCDFFDTVVHRKVHPNYVVRIWAKIMIRELGLEISIDELYFIRKEAERYLMKKYGRHYVEISYDEQIEEIYNRLVCNNVIENISKHTFSESFKQSEFSSEIRVQYINKKTLKALYKLKKEGYQIFCVSDFYTSTELVEKFISHHGFAAVYDGVFVSSDVGASKHSGSLYKNLLEQLGVEPSEVVMIGDNKKSDVLNARKAGIHAIHWVSKKQIRKRKLRVFGNDRSRYRKVLKNLYKSCNSSSAPPNSDYILFYTVFIERLYAIAKRDSVKNLFFLSREGLYLKKLFDHYQKHIGTDIEDRIHTHYFRISRQASLLISLKTLDAETFPFLRKKYPNLSLVSFLKNFNFSESLVHEIITELGLLKESDLVINSFLDSDIFKALKGNQLFIDNYNNLRIEQKKAFQAYLESFGVNILSEGMHLVDIGWGGTVQETLFNYFEERIPILGYYLGLREVYDIKKNTKRFGLNFRIYPYPTYSDNILMANYELNEQLLSSPHGSVKCYTTKSQNKSFTVESHDEVEQRVFHDYISHIQDFMFEKFKEILNHCDTICYTDEMVQQEMTNYALRIGLFARKANIESSINIHEGFFTNVGNFDRGLKLGVSIPKSRQIGYLKTFIVSPEKVYKVLLRIKPLLYLKNRYYLAYFIPTRPIFIYFKLNYFIKNRFLKRFFHLRYSYLK